VDFHYFHERLAPHGHWIEVDGHGWCWYPSDEDDDWRPYCHGHWVYVEEDGWCWVSDYEWGWAPFHYGRWTFVETRWVWVPGYEWSGAWVVWRSGGGYVGWAPLPPAVGWSAEVGIRHGDFDFEVDIHEPSWVFVADVHFTDRGLKSLIKPHKEVGVVIGQTRVLGSVKLKGSVIVNDALEVKAVEKFTGREVKRVKIEATHTLGAARISTGEAGTLRVFRPRVSKADRGSPRDVDIEKAERATLREKHEAENEQMKGRHERERDGRADDEGLKDRQRKEAGEQEERHKREDEGIKKRSPEKPDKGREAPDKGRKDPGDKDKGGGKGGGKGKR
jgi:hypothetical protein